MSTTQQRYLTHSDELFLVYTRKTTDSSSGAQVAIVNKYLLRDTEQIALPLIGDGYAPGDAVSWLGSFHTGNVSANGSRMTIG